MPRRVGILERVVLHIGVAIERLGVYRPHRATHLLAALAVELEPEAHAVLTIDLAQEAALMEAHRQRLNSDVIHATARVARNNRIG